MAIPLSIDEYHGLLSMDPHAFFERCFEELHPQTRFMPSRYLELLASRLEDCRLGRTPRLIVNLPPRHTKSILTSVAFPAWLLGHNPGLGIICASYGQDLADTFARQCRAVMTSGWYQRVFPTRLARNSLGEITTTRGGYRFATSVGGVLTGRGADVIIIDDPMKPDEALSDARRKAVNDWYDNTLLSRLNSQDKGVIILVMQRLHMDDLVGHVMGGE